MTTINTGLKITHNIATYIESGNTISKIVRKIISKMWTEMSHGNRN